MDVDLFSKDLDIFIDFDRYRINVFFMSYLPGIPSWHYERHYHSGYELHLIPTGYGELKVDGDIYDIKPSCFYMTGPYVYHEQRSDSDNPMVEYSINFDIQLKENAGDLDADSDRIIETLVANPFWFGEDSEGMYRLLAEIRSELIKRDLGYYVIIQGLIRKLLIMVARHFDNSKTSAYWIGRKTLDDKRRIIADRYFRTHYTESARPGELASQLGVSERQLNRLMQDLYGMTFKRKQLSMKLEDAVFCLSESDMTVEEIALKTGFKDSSYFCKKFKLGYGITASEYRRRYGITDN